jgi:hypothetical protein
MTSLYFAKSRTFLFFSATVCFLCLSGQGLLSAAEVLQEAAVREAPQNTKAEQPPPQPAIAPVITSTVTTVVTPAITPTTPPAGTPAPETKIPPAAANWALGVLYPGASLKYMTGDRDAWELRAQSGSGIFALGSRYYRYFAQAANPRLFWGAEADYLTFKGKVSKGAGFAGGAFAGGEIFLTREIGLLMDFGPMYISLSDKNFSESASNLEYVMNMGIYWHFK